MTIELLYLALVASFTALMWIPYVLERFFSWGLMDTLGYPSPPKPQAPWAERMKAAHANAVQNLVVFATLVLVTHAAGISTTGTVVASIVYFWGRVVHFIAYTVKLPILRTLGFVAGFGAQMVFAWQHVPRLWVMFAGG